MIGELVAMIRENSPMVVLTGAGMSTESGLPDFRSSTGLWKGRDPAKMASIWALRSDPDQFYQFYRMRLDGLRKADPNAGHEALARLEEMGLLSAIVTQNVDGLHQKAGSKRVIELHGSLRLSRCNACDKEYPIEMVALSEGTPFCEVCGGLVRPDVVLFGESLPQGALEDAFSEARKAGLFVVVGSSLEVSPANMLPGAAKEGGARLAIVNLAQTPLDDMTDLVLREKSGDVLSRVLEAVQAEVN